MNTQTTKADNRPTAPLVFFLGWLSKGEQPYRDKGEVVMAQKLVELRSEFVALRDTFPPRAVDELLNRDGNRWFNAVMLQSYPGKLAPFERIYQSFLKASAGYPEITPRVEALRRLYREAVELSGAG